MKLTCMRAKDNKLVSHPTLKTAYAQPCCRPNVCEQNLCRQMICNSFKLVSNFIKQSTLLLPNVQWIWTTMFDLIDSIESCFSLFSCICWLPVSLPFAVTTISEKGEALNVKKFISSSACGCESCFERGGAFWIINGLAVIEKLLNNETKDHRIVILSNKILSTITKDAASVMYTHNKWKIEHQKSMNDEIVV
jgi:hypothetical protein